MQSQSVARHHARSPGRDRPIALVTDASTTATGAVLQQQTKDTGQTLTFFSKEMSTAHRNIASMTENVWLFTTL